MTTLLSVEGLHVHFRTRQGTVQAVRGVSLALEAGEAVAIVGESGSGKSVTGRALLGLVVEGGEVRGSVRFEGRELVGRTERELNQVRGVGIGMVFQDALDGLNPVFTVGSQIAEALRVRMGRSPRQARDEAVQLLSDVGIPDAQTRAADYPHQFSGGMRQRVCIALAIALRPRMLIADEPTTALDVTVQAGILRLLRSLREEYGMALVFITHDLAVARLVAERVVVMYRGKIVEQGSLQRVFGEPRHPYTQALLASHPARARSWRDLVPMPENLPSEAGAAPGLARPISMEESHHGR